jgi:hypothetical protein
VVEKVKRVKNIHPETPGQAISASYFRVNCSEGNPDRGKNSSDPEITL